jgi:replicative DNA helicase
MVPKTDTMPCSYVAEVAVIFLMVLYPECREKALRHLQDADFHFGSSKQFFQAIKQVDQERAPITEWTIYERVLNASPEVSKAYVGADWLDVLQMCDVPFHLAGHMEKLIDTSTRRALHALADKLRTESIDTGQLPEVSSRDLINQAEERLRALRRESSSATEQDIKDLFASFEDDYAKKGDGDARRGRSVTIGIESMDAENRGPFGSELVVIAARPSVGKTALGLQAAIAAAHDDAPAYIFSLEMSKEQIRERCIAHMSGIEVNRIRTRAFEGEDLRLYTNAKERFQGICRVNFKRGVTSLDICQAARTAHRVLGIKIVMVDYLGLIMSSGRKEEKEYQTIGNITRDLKLLALELEIPVLLLVQLNRESEKADREPRLSDLAQSGRIEQDADQVWALHAPKGIGDPSRTLIVLKGRNTGAGHRVNLTFLTDVQQLHERAA